ncbi:MAG: 2-dehydropantoate 2-reductase [Acidobacteria bacterium]|nr:MAG: 2-dehydropantoate 2-reductase [Acidobacteriota bacterium]
MRDAGLHHAILGPGGIGGLVGACLAHSGGSVTLVVKPESLAQYPRRLHLESPFGNFNAEVACASEVPPADVLWIAVKATQLESGLTALKNPGSGKAIVPLLNGIDHLSLLRSRYGADRVIPATIAVESERLGPGHIVHRSPFARLNVSTAGRTLLGRTAEHLQQMGFECRFIENEFTLMWSKLVFLGPYALTTTAADKAMGGIISDPSWREQLEACVREACDVAIAEGAKVDPEAILAGMKGMPGNMRSSMQKDVEQHKTPERDAIAGPILRGARRHNIDIPATTKLVAVVEQRADGVNNH